MQNLYSKIISYVVFAFTLIIILINTASLLFPSLIITQMNETVAANPFELGAWALPVIITNIIILALGILFFTNKIPEFIKKTFSKIYNFEVSKNVATLVFVILLFGYIGFAMSDINEDEADTWGDYQNVYKIAEKWPETESGRLTELQVLHVKNFLLKSSIVLFNNIKVLPFLVSISLVILTYFFTVKISHKKFAGLVAMAVLIQSYTFLRFDTLATYENSWTLFYLLSLYLIYKKWPLSPISYIASIFSKPLTLVFLPMTIFVAYRAEILQNKKIRILIMYIALFVALIVIGLTVKNPLIFVGDDSSITDFWAGFTTWSFHLRFDTLFLILIIPVTVCLFLKSRSGFLEADSVLFLIAGSILAMPLLAGLTGYNIHPYRDVPLIVFFAIGVGFLFAKKVKQEA